LISILLRYSDGYYKNDLAPTIGVDFKVKVVQSVPAPDETTKCVKMTIWDTGKEFTPHSYELYDSPP
jgi:hypothetical protein